MRKHASIAAKVVVAAVLVYYWYRYIQGNRQDLSAGGWDFGWWRAVISSIFIAAGYLIRACLWAPMRFELTGERMTLRDSFRVSSISWMGRYVPGKIWTVAGKAWLSSRDRSRVPEVGMAIMVEILWFQLGGVLVAVLTLVFSGGRFLSPETRIILAAVLAAGLVACHPRVFMASANAALRVMRRPPLVHRPRYRVMLLLMIANVATFLLWGTGFSVLGGGVSALGAGDFPFVTGIFAAAWVLGFFMILVPAGIGVRESILMFGLRGMGLDDPAIIKLVLASRVLMTLVELLFFLAALAMAAGGGRRDGGVWEDKARQRVP